MMRYLLFTGFFTLTACLMMAQSQQSGSSGDLLKQLEQAEASGEIHLQVDSLLTANYYKLLEKNKEVTGVPGWRIRIFSDSGLGAKEEQQRVRARFLSLYPDIDAYHVYDEPYFKVYVGDCRTESEAIRLYDRIKKDFPDLLQVQDYINLKDKEKQPTDP
jgi:hypothetical protein